VALSALVSVALFVALSFTGSAVLGPPGTLGALRGVPAAGAASPPVRTIGAWGDPASENAGAGVARGPGGAAVAHLAGPSGQIAGVAGQVKSAPAHVVPQLGPHSADGGQTLATTNWSGYVDTGAQFTGVSGSWVVPAVQDSAPTQASATWIGIDGFSDDTLIQTGTEQITSGGATSYDAWYELLPADPVRDITETCGCTT